ncbi:multidrug effflux MFS transporter [Actibacterium sp. 188UL27-1]|nr:multidrug effflux MFS transporter [Actibacterium sp. 188UL27-1]MBM7068189.1 multidrug effflux MFS transporter [Actibacterium sp. 188UL27-1]
MVTLVVLTGVSLMSLNMYLPSLAGMAVTFDVDYAVVNASISGYLAITAVLQLILGPLSDRFGRRPVILVGIAFFALASVGCALATDIRVFLAFRILQGAIIVGSALSRAVIQDMFPPQEAASRMGYVSMAMALAPLLSPMVGGALDELFGWRANFWLFTGVGAALLALCWWDLGETNATKSETFVKQFQAYPDLFRSRRFWGYSLCMMFSVGVFFAFLGGAPLVATTEFDLTPAMLGLCMGATPLGFLVGSFLSGRYAARMPLIRMILIGRTVAVFGLATGLILMLMGYVTVFVMFGSVIFVGLGNGLSMPSTSAGALAVRPKLAGSAAGLSGAMMVGGGAMLNSIAGAVLVEGHGIFLLFGVLLVSAVMALLMALYVLSVDQAEARAATAS